MRKQPTQARSRAMVERLVAAGRATLLAEGYDAFSTNRVAQRAQVSPGSLYQYFPDKAALLDVVVERYWDDVSERVAASLADHVGELGRPMVRAVGDALLTALEADRALLRVVAEELPVRRSRPRLSALEQRVRELAGAYLAARPDAHRRPSAPAAAWVVVLAVEHLASRWVLDRPPGIDRDAVLDEIVTLVSGYLLDDADPAA